MQLIIAILLYLGVVTSSDQVTEQVILDNQTAIDSYMNNSDVVVGTIWED